MVIDNIFLKILRQVKIQFQKNYFQDLCQIFFELDACYQIDFKLFVMYIKTVALQESQRYPIFVDAITLKFDSYFKTLNKGRCCGTFVTDP